MQIHNFIFRSHKIKILFRLWEMDHNIFELEIPVNNKSRRHIMNPSRKLRHNLMNDFRRDLPRFGDHQLFQIASITQLQKNIEVHRGSDCFNNSNNMLTCNHLLIPNLSENHLLFTLWHIRHINYFTCKIFILIRICLLCFLFYYTLVPAHRLLYFASLGQVYVTILSVAQDAISINNIISDFLEMCILFLLQL